MEHLIHSHEQRYLLLVPEEVIDLNKHANSLMRTSLKN